LKTAYWLKFTVSAGLLAGFLLSRPLWLSSRLYPLTPVWPGLGAIPAPVEVAVLAVLLGLLVWIAAKAQPARAIAAFVALAASYAMFDQSRWQPWFYQYLVMMAALALESTLALSACRLIVVCVYFWSGVSKINPLFVQEAFPWMLEPLTQGLPRPVIPYLYWLGYVAPFVEMAIAVGLAGVRFRRPAAIAALAMHTFILASIATFGHNYDAIVWPWNFAMGAMVWLLFYTAPERASGLQVRGWFGWVVVVLFGIAPALSLVNLWDGYLSFALYSGNRNSATIYLADAVADRLPEAVQEYITENDDSLVDELDVFDWSFGELRVPPYAEIRIFRNVGRRVCAMAGEPREMVLVVQGKWSWFRRRRQVAYTCRDLR